MSTQQTLQQERARSAWNDVAGVVKKPLAKEYGSLVRGLPSMIQSDGLAPSLAFLLAKAKAKEKEKENSHRELYNHVSQWVMSRLGQNGDLMQYVLKCDSLQYRQAASEALAYLSWLKRFAEAQQLGDQA